MEEEFALLERERSAGKDTPATTLPDSLVLSLETAIAARSLIKPLQNDLLDLLNTSENDIEQAARQYQIDLIDWQLSRAADLAEYRLHYLQNIRTQSQIDAEVIKCKTDIVHFFRTYMWGFDPRPDSPLTIVPFELFEFQIRFCNWLDEIVFTKRTSGVVEKARDMGATETALRWAIHRWLFSQGFSCILLSANEDLVDSKKNQNTLFEKLRFQLRLFPSWLLPAGFNLNSDMPYMSIVNPTNNAAFLGYAPTPNVGRQSRATCVIKDESAAWQFGGLPQHTSLSATTKSQIDISSVQGKNNKFSDLTHDNVTAKFEMDWREHPWKDERWYQSLPYGYLSSAMTEQQIAQEIDRNYDASQPGKVFTNLREEYVFITWTELLAHYAQHGLDTEFKSNEGKLQIPRDWNWGRTFDYGQTTGHKFGYMIMARPAEHFPLHDSYFVFCAQPMPQAGTTEQQAVAQWRYWERTLGLRNDADVFIRQPEYSECSHEQNSMRDTLIQIYGESWTAWDTDYNDGISQIRAWFSIVDQNKPNPFRPNLMGRATIYFVAPPSEYVCAFNDKEGKHFVTPSQTEWGFKLLREEFSEYHYAPEERFKPPPLMRPVKIKDDVIDCLVAGTLILTDRGDVPIEAVTTADKVMTRQGWKPVIAAGLSQRDVKTVTLRVSNGFQITATDNHRILTDAGFVCLRGLAARDTVFVWQKENKLNTKASHFIGILNQPTPRIVSITKRTLETNYRAFHTFISRYGKTITAKCRKVGTSTIKTVIAETITSPILSVYRQRLITLFTLTNNQFVPVHLSNTHYLRESDHLPQSGTERRKDTRGIARTARKRGQIVKNKQESVSIAGRNSVAKRITKSSALTFASGASGLALCWKVLRRIVNFVRHQCLLLVMPPTKTPKDSVQKAVVVSLVGNTERSDVYNLTVADCPEYFANGILVHNCLRGHATHWGATVEPLTPKMKYERRLKAMLPPQMQGEVQLPELETVGYSPSLTLQMNEMRLRREMIEAGETLPNSPFDEDYPDDITDISGGW